MRVTPLFALLFVLASPANAGVTPWIDLEIVDGHILLPTEIDGIPGKSIIDTGASITAVNGNFLEAHELEYKRGRSIEIRGVHGVQKRPTYRRIPGAILGGKVEFAGVVDLNLDDPEIQLLIGANFFQNYIFQFDYTNERMRLITRDTVDLKAIRNVETKKDGSLVVRATMNGKDSAWLLMDTGSTGGLLVERSFANRLGWDQYQKLQGTSTGAISSGTMEYFRIPSLEVGPFALENVLVSMPAEGQQLQFFEEDTQAGTRFTVRRSAEGILGYDVLKHFVVTIDYDKGYVHFYPGEKEAEVADGQ